MPPRTSRAAACAALAAMSSAVPAVETVHRVDPETAIHSWETRSQDVSLRLTQILPGQVRGFYLARGFDAAAAERIAHGCVFQTVLRNESARSVIRFNLSDWRVILPGETRALKLEHDWQQEWAGRGLTESARSAFRWALFPTEHSYEPGDWNMGMTTYALPAGSLFDLRFVWHTAHAKREALLKGLRCAREE